MASVSILKDAVRDTNFGVIVKEQENTKFYGFHELGSEWAKEAENSFAKTGEYSMPDGISQTAFKTVSKSILENIVKKTSEIEVDQKSFTGVILEKVASLKPNFKERVKFDKKINFESKSLEEKINANSNKFSKTDKINLKIRKFISSNKKASFALGMKNSGLAIESRSGSIISAKNDDALMGQAIELQEKLGDGFTRRFIRLKNLDSSTQSQNRRALRRAGSISPVATKGEDRISIAKKEVHERF